MCPNISYYERSRDARGRFVARAGSHGSITSPRTHSQPGQERSPVGVATRRSQVEVEETQPEMQPLSAHGVHQISFSKEDTEQLKDVEDDDVSEQPAWDYSDFRRRSSILSGLLRAANNRGSAGTGQRRQPRPQPVAVMAAQIKFQSPLYSQGGRMRTSCSGCTVTSE